MANVVKRNRKEYNRMYYLNNKDKILTKNKNWLINNKERHKKYQSSYEKANRWKYRKRINNTKRIYREIEWVRKKDNVRRSTNQKYGYLDKGFVYHHTEPYNKDNFLILEKKFHNFYHKNKMLFNMEGRL